MEYLDFELPLKDLNDQLENCKKLGNVGKVDVKDTLQEIKSKLLSKKKEIYSSLSPWQRVQLSRHPSRPYTLDYLINMTNNNFLELHGDRNIKDDKAMIAGLGIGGLALALAAQDSVKNIFAGIMIFLDKPFKITDRIKIDGHDGVVEEVGLRSTRIRTLEGRIVTIPNCTFTDNSVINVTSQPALKVKINLGLTYDTSEDDMQKAVSYTHLTLPTICSV